MPCLSLNGIALQGPGKRFLQILDVFGYTEEELENWIKNLPPKGVGS